MLGVDHNLAFHKLDVDPSAKPVRQRPRRMAPDRWQKVNEEIDRLLSVGFIKQVEYPKWIFNIVAVPKKNGQIRVCINFTNLNKTCPMCPYPLPRISDLVDATIGYQRLSFLDAFSGYNWIPLYQPDQIHTFFVTDSGLYCYIVMPFGLKNIGVNTRGWWIKSSRMTWAKSLKYT